MSARRCSRRSPARRGSCWAADADAVLVPDPDYPEPWAWAYDVEARHWQQGGCGWSPVPGRSLRDLAASISSCRWSPGAIISTIGAGSRCSTVREAEHVADDQSARAAALEQRQGLSSGACGPRCADRADSGRRSVRRCGSGGSAALLRQRVAGDQAAGLRQRHGHASASGRSTTCRRTAAGSR